MPRQNIIDKYYRVEDGNGGHINWRFIFSDIAKALLIALLLAAFKGGWGTYNDAKVARVEADTLRKDFDAHCSRQTDTEEKMLQALGRIEGRLSNRRDNR